MRFLAMVGLVAGMGVVSADAATFNFQAKSSGGWSNSIVYDPIDGIGLTVSGSTVADGSAKVQTWKDFGLGVKSSDDCDSGRYDNQCEGDDHQVDSTGPDDIAVFLFTEAVRIVSITFNPNYVNSTDTFDFYVGGTETLTAQQVTSTVTVGDLYDPTIFDTSFAVGAGQTTTQVCYKSGYWIWTTTTCKDKDVTSAFKITSITVEKAPPPPPTVPLPAGGLLLVGAIGGLAALRRASRRVAAE